MVIVKELIITTWILLDNDNPIIIPHYANIIVPPALEPFYVAYSRQIACSADNSFWLNQWTHSSFWLESKLLMKYNALVSVISFIFSPHKNLEDANNVNLMLRGNLHEVNSQE